MTMSDATEKQEAGTRAGGNVETKGASTAGEASPRAGGNVETKGASGGANEEEGAKEKN